jgi:hypothetical protein
MRRVQCALKRGFKAGLGFFLAKFFPTGVLGMSETPSLSQSFVIDQKFASRSAILSWHHPGLKRSWQSFSRFS